MLPISLKKNVLEWEEEEDDDEKEEEREGGWEGGRETFPPSSLS